MNLLRTLHILRNVVFGIIFISVGGYLVVGQWLGYSIEFPGGVLNYIFGTIAFFYGVMRLVLYKRGYTNPNA